MPVLTRTTVVLERHDGDDTGTVYQQNDDDGRLVLDVLVPEATYVDLGRPTTITVTVEAGDTLNP